MPRKCLDMEDGHLGEEGRDLRYARTLASRLQACSVMTDAAVKDTQPEDNMDLDGQVRALSPSTVLRTPSLSSSLSPQ